MERHRAAVVARLPEDVAQADLLKALSEEYRNLSVADREVSQTVPVEVPQRLEVFMRLVKAV